MNTQTLMVLLTTITQWITSNKKALVAGGVLLLVLIVMALWGASVE